MTSSNACEDLGKRTKALEAELDKAKRTVEALRDSEARFRKLAEKSLGVVYQFMMTPDGTYYFPYINESLRTVTGISPEDAMRDASVLVGKIHPKDIDRFHKGVLESANSLTSYHVAFRFFIDERQIWIEARSTPERLPDGSILWSGFFIDITERKLERDSLKRTQFAMDKAPDSILWVDDEGGIVYANEAACSSMEYTRDELQTMKVFDIDPDFPLDRWEQHKEDLRRLGTMTFEGRHIAKDGRLFPVEVSSRYFKFNDRWLACAFDRNIADRKQAEAVIRKNENNLRSLFNAIFESVFLMDRNGTLLTSNDTFARRLGKTVEECIGQSVYSLISPDLVERRKALVDKVLRTGQPVQFEDERHGRFLSHSLFPVLGADGTVERIAVFAMDVTEHRRTGEALRESERILKSIFEAAPAGLALLKDRTFIRVNKALCRITGYAEDEMVGMNTRILYPDDEEYHRIGRDLYEKMKREGLGVSDMVLQRKDGERIDVILNLTPFNPEDSSEGVCASVLDITERKTAEQELRKLSRMQSVILNNSTVGIALVRNRVFEWVNPRMSELFGIPAEQFKGASTRMLFLNDELYERLGAENYTLFAQGKKAALETVMCKGDGSTFWCRLEGRALDASRPHDGSIWIWEDISDHKRAEEALEKRVLALTRPLDAAASIAFEDLFNIDDIQRLQDEFAKATGVASLITRTDGTPITSPSNFCRLCIDIIRKTEKGLANCMRNDSVIGRASIQGPTISPCLSGGLWDAGAGISVSGRHIANWLIGQVRDETQTEENMRRYAREIGADEKDLINAFREVPAMPREQFERVAQALYTLAKQLSNFAYQNVQQARFITERRKAEAALRESEQRFRSLVETTSDMVWEINQDGFYTYVSPKVEDLLGYTPDEVIGKSPFDLMPSETSQAVISGFQELMKDRRPFSALENLNLHKDGRQIMLETSGVPIFTENGVFSGYRGIDRNITDRKEAEKALRESEIRHRSILENTGTTMLILEEDMTISFANAEFEKLTGYQRQDVVGVKQWTEFVHKSDLERMIHQHRLRRTADANLAERSYEFRLVHRDGRLKDIYLIADMIPGTTQSVTSLIDITDRKRAEAELHESRRRLEDIIEFLPDATMVIDKDGRLIAWNRAMEIMTGVKKEDMLGKGDYEYALPFYGERRPVLIDFALRPNLEIEKEYTALQRVGDTILGEAYTPILPSGNVHLSGTASVLRDSRSEIVGAIECLRDNTERKRLEERLKRAEKMEVLGTLAGGVAHDLNNMLGVVVGYSELLAEKLPDASPLRKYADNIRQSSIRSAAIIQDLLTLTRRGVTVSEVVDLNRLVLDYFSTPEFESLNYYHPQVSIRHELEEGILHVKGSPVHLTKTVMNLVSNAAEAVSGFGEVTIRTENRHLDHPLPGYENIKEGDYVALTVSDTGGGISADDLGRIFEPFYTKKVMGRSGTGLGLAVVWGAVKDHRGYIDVQSEEGKGSTFSLYFPATREDPERVEKAPLPVSYAGQGESILVVDDVKEQREVAITMLERLGYRVEAVPGGKEAVEYLKNKKADLIVLDMIMDPGINGMETYRRILEINPKQKAVIVSGFSETDQVRSTLEMGAGTFVRKPYVLEKIGLAVRKELDRSDER